MRNTYCPQDLCKVYLSWLARFSNSQPLSNAMLISILPDTVIDNSRYATKEFRVPVSTMLHGFAGYFDCVLYKDVTLSKFHNVIYHQQVRMYIFGCSCPFYNQYPFIYPASVLLSVKIFSCVYPACFFGEIHTICSYYSPRLFKMARLFTLVKATSCLNFVACEATNRSSWVCNIVPQQEVFISNDYIFQVLCLKLILMECSAGFPSSSHLK